MPSLISIVPALEICLRLRAVGFPQNTALAWRRSTVTKDHQTSVHAMGESSVLNIEDIFEDICAAPTAEEILNELPWVIQPWLPNIEHAFLTVARHPDGFRVQWFSWDNKHEVPDDNDYKRYEKESEAAAIAYLWWKKEVAG